MMLKKKDKLLDILKNNQKYHILQYLINQDLHELALCSKKYFMMLLPYIKLKQLDEGSEKSSQSDKDNKDKVKKNKKNKNNKTHKNSYTLSTNQHSLLSSTIPQTQITITKLTLIKWFKQKQTSLPQWTRIQSLPYYNSYLQQKLLSKNYIFFHNSSTSQIMYLNRSMIDPNLNFQKGAFSDQLELEDIYQHMYDDRQNNGEMDVDVTSREMMLKRQKEMLQKINKKKQLNQEKQTIFYQKQLQKACTMNKYAIILCFGGSFSIAIYSNFQCLTHKSDKKYVCRKKAGQRQLNKDKQSGSSIKSMGSQIRRDQQKKHVINVNQILNQYRDELFKCQHIFLQAPGINRLYIINENQTMGLLQKKLRSVCKTAKKANFTEIQGLNEVINQVHIVKIKGETEKEVK